MADVKFKTESGLKSAKKAARHEIEGFLEMVYFKEEVLKKYESNKDYTIGDNGTVLFGYKWGLFRGICRVAKGFLVAHLGDIGEGLPEAELKHWKQYNVNYSEVPTKERYFDFRDTIRRMLHFMKKSNERIESHLNKFFFDIELNDKRLFKLDNIESILRSLNKVINKKTTLDDFQARIIFINILLLENINSELILKILKKVDSSLCYSYNTLAIKEAHENYLFKQTPIELKNCLKRTIHPLTTLELLKKFLLFLRVHYDVISSLKIRKLSEFIIRKHDIYRKTSKIFSEHYKYKIYNKDFKNRKYLTYNEEKIGEDTNSLKLLNKFRNESSAHGFSKKKYKKFLDCLNIDKKNEDYSEIYSILISKVSYDMERIYFNLFSPDPAILEYYKNYMKESLDELHASNSSRYESIFEDIISYIDEFPELYPYIIRHVKKEYLCHNKDSNFILALGGFIESLSMRIKDTTQELIDLLLPSLEYDKALTIARFGHIIKYSKKITPEFFKKIKPIVYEGIKDKKTVNVNSTSQWIIFCLIERFPNLLNKEEIKQVFKQEKIQFDLIKKYIR